MSIGLICGSLNAPETSIVVLNRHGDKRLLPHLIPYVEQMRGLVLRGVTHVVALHTVGAIAQSLNVGDVVIPEDLIDYTHSRQEHVAGCVRHLEASGLFNAEMRQLIIQTLQCIGVPFVSTGVMAVVQGPRLETPAEIRRLRNDGNTLVGMTAMPEAAIAKQMGIKYASLALVVDMAAGLDDPALSTEFAMTQAQDEFKVILPAFLEALKVLYES